MQTICFPLKHLGRDYGASWARIVRSTDGGRIVECRQVMKEIEAIGLRKSRQQSRYVFNSSGALISAEMRDHNGNQISLEISLGKMRTAGRSLPLASPISFVLEANTMALSVALLEENWPGKEPVITALIPATGAVLPYRISKQHNDWTSSLGETFHTDGKGTIRSVTVSASDFVFERSNRAFPKWTLDESRSVISYSPPKGICVEDVSLPLRGCKEKPHEATVSRPNPDRRSFAAGVFVGGTGVYTRHGQTASLDFGYHQLLDDLAAEGLSTLRYERFSPQAMDLEEAESNMGFKEICADAGQALNWLSAQAWAKGKSKIMVGHSFGGLVALEQSANRNDLGAIVLLCSPGRPLRTIVDEQRGWFLQHAETSRNARNEMKALNHEFISALKSNQEWTAETVDPRIFPLKRKRKLYSEILDLDPAALAANGRCPVIIVQGTNDVQVSITDAKLLAESCEKSGRPYQIHLEDGLDHLLRRNTETGLKVLKVYRDRRRRIPIRLIRKIAKYIEEAAG
ncbi:hypothetical protein JCM17960_18310 [Magnetospira thiophila]